MEERKIEDARDAIKDQERNPTAQVTEFADPVRFLSTVSFSELPESPILTAPTTVTTLSVLNTTRVKLGNTGAVTVVDLTSGQEGQNVLFLGDGNTTFANNTKIKTSSGANKLLAANSVYSFTFFMGVWYEAAVPAATTFTAGDGITVSGSTITNKYVGKHMTMTLANVTFTRASTSPEGVSSTVLVADLTGMTQIRYRYGANNPTTTFTPSLGWSTDAITWNTFATGTSRASGSSGGYLENWVALPAGAQIATAYLRFQAGLTSNGATVTMSGMQVEVKP